MGVSMQEVMMITQAYQNGHCTIDEFRNRIVSIIQGMSMSDLITLADWLETIRLEYWADE